MGVSIPLVEVPTGVGVTLRRVPYVLTDDQQELLRVVGSAYSYRSRDGSKQPFMLLTAMGEGPWLQHEGLPDGSTTVDVGDLEELASKGLVSFLSRRNAYDGQFRVTAEGERHAQVLEQLRWGSPEGASRLSLDWEEVLPILRAVLDTWEKAGAPAFGVSAADVAVELGRDTNDDHLDGVLRQLQTAGYLNAGPYSNVTSVLPARRTHELLSGWPGEGSDVLYQRLLRILDSRIEQADTPEEKTKLEAVRDRFIDLGQTVAGGVLTALATGSL